MSGFKLPSDFYYGFASASYQIEGSPNVDGRGPSIWDDFCRRKGAIKDGSSGEHATDSYNLYEKDIGLLESLGAKAYRFSISWSRIIPLGGAEDPINPKGIEFYNKIIDLLLKKGITPFITLYHWDLPSKLQERYKGWLDKERITRDYTRYARVCFENFGDRVAHWITLNEPLCSTILGHALGIHAPGRSSNRDTAPEGDSTTEPWIAGHNLLIAHASAVGLYRKEFAAKAGGRGGGLIGITLNCDWVEPFDDKPENIAAAQRARDFCLGWFADPVYLTGDYPHSMRKQLGCRLPTFTAEEKDLVHGSSDFYGMNTYSSNWVMDRPEPATEDDFVGNIISTVKKDGKLIGNQGGPSWLKDVPWGFEKLLKYVWDRYNVPIYVTENGFAVKGENDFTLARATDDQERVHYFKGYLEAMKKAMESGVVVKSYFAWSLLDNFEWAEGYTERFGVVHVDYKTQTRTVKASGKYLSIWFAEHTGN